MPDKNPEPEIEILSSQAEAYDDAGNAAVIPDEPVIPRRKPWPNWKSGKKSMTI